MLRAVGYAMQKQIVERNTTLIEKTLNYLKENPIEKKIYYCKGPSFYNITNEPEIIRDNLEPIKKKNLDSQNVYLKCLTLIAFLKNRPLITNYVQLFGEYVTASIKEIENLAVDPYASAILAYVMALEGTPNNTKESLDLLDQLKESNSKTNGDYRFFYYNTKSDYSINLQISAYVALAYLTMKYDEKVALEIEPLVKWFASRKTFGEPHNKALALEVLTEAAKFMTKLNTKYELTIKSSSQTEVFNIDNNNWHNYVYKEISTNSKEVSILAVGQGYLSVDIVCEHYRNESIYSEFIELNVTTSGKDDKIKILKMCVRSNEEINEQIILEVQLQSGFVYDTSINGQTNNHVKVGHKLLITFNNLIFLQKVEVFKKSTIFTVYLQDKKSNFV